MTTPWKTMIPQHDEISCSATKIIHGKYLEKKDWNLLFVILVLKTYNNSLSVKLTCRLNPVLPIIRFLTKTTKFQTWEVKVQHFDKTFYMYLYHIASISVTRL